MTDLNDFIVQKQPQLKYFLNEVSEIPRKPIDEVPTAHTRINFGKEMAFLVEYMEENRGALEVAFPNDEMVGRLIEVLVQLRKKAQDVDSKGLITEDTSTSILSTTTTCSTSTTNSTNYATSSSSSHFQGSSLSVRSGGNVTGTSGQWEGISTSSGEASLDSTTNVGTWTTHDPTYKKSKHNVLKEQLAELLDIPEELTNEEKLTIAVEALQENLDSLKKRYIKLQTKHIQLAEEHKEN